MTKGERSDLAQVVRLRAKVAKEMLAQRESALLAAREELLAARSADSRNPRKYGSSRRSSMMGLDRGVLERTASGVTRSLGAGLSGNFSVGSPAGRAATRPASPPARRHSCTTSSNPRAGLWRQ